MLRLPTSSVVFPPASVHSGGVADSISKWVFRHSLPPESLKAFLQKSEGPEDGRHKKTGEQPEKQSQKQEKAQETAGQDTHFTHTRLV